MRQISIERIVYLNIDEKTESLDRHYRVIQNKDDEEDNEI
jgi:hypothetical protein